MGGGGKYEHFFGIYNNCSVDAVSRANLLNFIGDSIQNTCLKLLDEGVNLARL